MPIYINRGYFSPRSKYYSYFGTIIWGKKRKFKLFRHMIWTLLTIFVQYYLDIALVSDL